MDKVHKILENAKNGIPQALARYNDGEILLMFNEHGIAARGCQRGGLELQTSLIEAIEYEQKNYWKGYPCPVCMSKQYAQLELQNMINHDYPYNTYAVVNTNRNLSLFQKGLVDALMGKQVVWVSGDDQDTSQLGFNIIEKVTFPNRDTWKRYQEVYNKCFKLVRPHRVFLFSCGPTSRVLVRNLFQLRPDATFFDVGSTYDNITRNVWHKCHRGTLPPCENCN